MEDPSTLQFLGLVALFCAFEMILATVIGFAASRGDHHPQKRG